MKAMRMREALLGQWQVARSPVLCAGREGDWDAEAVYTPQVIQESDGYRLYYTGRCDSVHWAIGMATSSDLIHWKKHPEPILRSGTEWDQQIDFPWPIKVKGVYHLFFEAKRLVHSPYPVDPVHGRWPGMTVYHMYSRTTGLAVSPDGIRFTKEPGPVFEPGPAGAWDANGICASRVYPWNDGFVMTYAGSDSRLARTGLAFSKDLRHWQRYERNPIMDVGTTGAWDSHSVLFGSVVALEDGYLGAYEGEDGERMQIGVAYSTDRIRWTRYEGNPVIQVPLGYRAHDTFVCAPCLVLHKGILQLLYTHNAPLNGKVARIEIAALVPQFQGRNQRP